MTVFLTGVAGFIASHLAEKLLKKGIRIIGIDNLDDYYDLSLKRYNLDQINSADNNNLFTFYEGDIRDKDFLQKIAEKHSFDSSYTLIHIAAMAGVRPSIQNPDLYVDVNVSGTQNLFELCRNFNIKQLVYASSSSVYGESTQVPFKESAAVDNPISPYAATKKANELMAHTYHHLFGINMIGLRFFTVYGARQRPDLAIHKFAKMIKNGTAIPFYGDGTTRRDYTYIDDIIDGIIKSMNYVEQNKNVYEVINLGESRTTTLSELVSLLEEKLQTKAILNKMPMQAGDVFQTFADISKGKKLISYQPKTLINEGLNYFVDWFKSYYKF